MQSAEEGFDMIYCKPLDRDLQVMDSSGYWFLIRPNFEQGVIEVAVCNHESKKPKNIVEIYYGNTAQDIYTKVLSEEKYKDKISLTHAAYLGKELKKAEFALVLGIRDHYQE